MAPLKKAPAALLAAIAIFFVVIFVVKNAIAKTAIEGAVKLATGLSLKIEHFDFSLMRSYVGIRALTLYNPRGFTDRVMVDMPEIYVNYKLAPFFKGKVHLEEIRLHLREFVVVKNQRGELNVDALKPVQTSKREAEARQRKETPKAAGKAPPLQVDRLALRIEKVVFKDYSKGPEPSVKEFRVNLNEEYREIQNLNGVVGMIILKVMMHTPIAALSGFDVGALEGSFSDALSRSGELARQSAAQAKAYLQEGDLQRTAESLEGASKELVGGLKGITGGLKDKFRSQFATKE